MSHRWLLAAFVLIAGVGCKHDVDATATVRTPGIKAAADSLAIGLEKFDPMATGKVFQAFLQQLKETADVKAALEKAQAELEVVKAKEFPFYMLTVDAELHVPGASTHWEVFVNGKSIASGIAPKSPPMTIPITSRLFRDNGITSGPREITVRSAGSAGPYRLFAQLAEVRADGTKLPPRPNAAQSTDGNAVALSPISIVVP